MATLPVKLSPLISKYVTGKPNGRLPLVVGNIENRLVLQDGIQGGRDEFNMDTLSVPFWIFAGADWQKLLPSRGDVIKDFSNMVVFDPMFSYSFDRTGVVVRVMLKGLLESNGVNNQWNGFRNNPKPKDATGLASAQISGTDGTSTMDITFYRPQTVYRYVTTADAVEPPQVINNANIRKPVLVSYAVRGSNTVPSDTNDGEGGDETGTVLVGFNLGVRQRCSEVSTEQVGKYFQNEATVVNEFYDTAGGS